jgi:hypothetical protein
MPRSSCWSRYGAKGCLKRTFSQPSPIELVMTGTIANFLEQKMRLINLPDIRYQSSSCDLSSEPAFFAHKH